jgi:hypothetical protein
MALSVLNTQRDINTGWLLAQQLLGPFMLKPSAFSWLLRI